LAVEPLLLAEPLFPWFFGSTSNNDHSDRADLPKLLQACNQMRGEAESSDKHQGSSH